MDYKDLTGNLELNLNLLRINSKMFEYSMLSDLMTPTLIRKKNNNHVDKNMINVIYYMQYLLESAQCQ